MDTKIVLDSELLLDAAIAAARALAGSVPEGCYVVVEVWKDREMRWSQSSMDGRLGSSSCEIWTAEEE